MSSHPWMALAQAHMCADARADVARVKTSPQTLPDSVHVFPSLVPLCFLACLCVSVSWPVFLSVSLAALFSLLAPSVPCLGSPVQSDVFIAIHQRLFLSTPVKQTSPPHQFPSSTCLLKLCPLSCQAFPTV